MKRKLITIHHGVARLADHRLDGAVDFAIEEGKSLAIYGVNGSGKSLLVDMLTGAQLCVGDAVKYDFGSAASHRVADNVRLVSFRDVYGGSEPAYYQQRWNRWDEQQFPTVGEALTKVSRAHHAPTDANSAKALPNADLLHAIGIYEHWDKEVNLLSSGELRRFQLARMLLSCPKVLIIDNPYIGLDKAARTMLTGVLEHLAQRLTLVLVVCRPDDVPPFIDTVVRVENKTVGEVKPRSQFSFTTDSETGAAEEIFNPADRKFNQPDRNFNPADRKTDVATRTDEVIDFRHIHIGYGNRTILRDLSWTVRRGEHWALTGENGSGKSTLLSLVCADNPQAYACDIHLFGNRRGSGESIWEIKKHIGYVSPEIFSTYRKNLPAIDIVASGLHDTIGLYRRTTPEEHERCRHWLQAFGAEHLAERNYLTLSSGEQRLVLLVRAFVKNPDLLILDEPFHGLDDRTRLRATRLIDQYMQCADKTLIMVTHYEEELPRCIDHRLTLIKQA